MNEFRPLSNIDRRKLSFQCFLCYLSLLLFYPMMSFCFFFVFRHRVDNLKILRKEFQDIAKKITDPLLICPNHLTYVDSVILVLIFGSYQDYLFHFHTYTWNFPTLKNMKHNWPYRLLCYLGKCQILDRQGSPETIKKAMKKAIYLLSQGNYVTIFPEGTRSRTGKVDTENFVYGVGKLLTNVVRTKTLCIYLRGSSQKTGSNFPKYKDNFYCELRLIEPKSKHHGLRAERDISTQIIQTLAQMEGEYFSKLH